MLTWLLPATLGAYAVAFVFAALPHGRGLPFTQRALGFGFALHLGWFLLRGSAEGYLPLTNKTESFSAAAFAMVLVLLVGWVPQRAFVLSQLGLALAAGVAAANFPQATAEPGPMLRTLWYVVHVPLSFVALATWSASAGSALCWALTKEKAWLTRTDHFALAGFGLWSVAMIFGGIWGAVAWGAYFLWDPKMVWSVILWFHAAGFVHVRLTPSLQQRLWVRPALAALGLVWVLIAYVGTSFFFGKSVHAF